MAIEITEEMRAAAERESAERAPYINHHFELRYMTGQQRDVVGFLGEFACKQCLGLDWRAGIRDNYEEIDDGDILMPNVTVDIKTETIPFKILMKLVKKQVGDDEPYGRRLINQGQIPLLEHYDYVVWGAFPRSDRNIYRRWYAFGYLETSYILEHYQPVIDTPFGKKYNEPCLNIRHSELKRIERLARILTQ